MKKNTAQERLKFLFQIARRNKTGIVSVRSGKAPRNFYVEDGMLRLVSGADPDVYYSRLLADVELIKPRRIARAEKAQDAHGGFLFSHVESLGYASRDDLLEILDYVARKELTRLVDEPGGSIRFVSGEHDLEPFGEGVESFLIDRDLESWVIDAAGARDAVEVFDTVFPSGKDVFCLASDLEPESEAGQRVLPLVDGLRTLEEIVADAPCSRFDVFRGLYRLEQSERIRRRTAAELVELAREFQKEGRLDHSQRMYVLAEHLGADGMDVAWNLGRSFELMGDEASAVDEYLKYARAAEENGDAATALRGLRKAIEIRPQDILIRESILKILDEQGNKEEAASEVESFVPVLMEERCYDRARDLLIRQLGAGGVDDAVCERLAVCFRELGDDERASFVETIERFEAEDRVVEILPVLEFLTKRTPDDTDLRVRRAVALDLAGRREEAAPLVESVSAELAGIDPSEDAERSEWIRRGFEILTAERPEHRPAREWLAAFCEGADRPDDAARHLEALAGIQESGGDLESLGESLRKLLVIDPENVGHRRRLGRTFLATGREAAGGRVLRELADEESRANRREDAKMILEDVLVATPWDLEALVARLEIARVEEDDGARRSLSRRGARLAVALERYDIAYDLLVEVEETDGPSAETIRRRIECLEQTGDRDGQFAAWRQLAYLERERSNLGSMREACERALEIEPEDEELASWIAPRKERPDHVGAAPGCEAEFDVQVLSLMRHGGARQTEEPEAERPAAPRKPEPAAPKRSPKARAAAGANRKRAAADSRVEPDSAKAAEAAASGKSFARSNKQEKPSISGIVQRLKSLKG